MTASRERSGAGRMAIAALVVVLSTALRAASIGAPAEPAEGTIPAFAFTPSPLVLSGTARPGTYFDKAGPRFAVLGTEDGAFEAWAWPLKLVREFRLAFLLGSSTTPVGAAEVARYFEASPSRSTVTYVHQAFTVRAHFVSPVEEPGAVVLLEIDAGEPLTVVAGFLPVLQPMWPAGLGGQSARWDEALKAYVISEPTGRNHAIVGSPAGRGISYAPAHMLSDAPNQFKIEVEHPDRFRGRFVPIVLAGGRRSRETAVAAYRRLASDPERACRAAEAHFEGLLARGLRVRTPVPEIGLALDWAKVAYDGLVVDNPDLGRGLVAGLGPSGTGGRPGFGWYFGGDAYINSLSLTGLGSFGTAREALAFTRKWQRADGKMAHELSQAAGYVDWWKDYPYGFIHGDTTPFYIVAADDYHSATGDAAFVRESWASLKKAFTWCLSTDANGDGLMDNARAGLGALEYGSLTAIRTDVYLASVWVRACEGMVRLARAAGDPALERKAASAHEMARRSFRTELWDERDGRYAYALKEAGGLVRELTPWSAPGLFWGIAGAEEAEATLEQLAGASLSTDWGLRTLSPESLLYDPLNYNYGAVWPFVTGWAAAAQFRNDRPLPGFAALMGSVRHMFDNALGASTEVFSGDRNIWPAEAVPHQGFSVGGAVLPIVRGLLGLESDAPARTLTFAPSFPADWDRVEIEGFEAGELKASFGFERSKGRVRADVVSSAPPGWRMAFRPAFGPGTKVVSASVNGRQAALAPEAAGTGTVRPSVDVLLTGRDEIEVLFVPTVEALPPSVATRTGDADLGLKVTRVRTTADGEGLEILVEGRGGTDHALPVTLSGRIASVEGAKADGAMLTFRIPGARDGGYARHRILVRTRTG